MARKVFSITSRVAGAFVPAMRASPLFANSLTNLRTSSRSPFDIAEYSPVEPMGTQPVTPAARMATRCFSNALKSTLPFASNGVMRAGITPESFIYVSWSLWRNGKRFKAGEFFHMSSACRRRSERNMSSSSRQSQGNCLGYPRLPRLGKLANSGADSRRLHVDNTAPALYMKKGFGVGREGWQACPMSLKQGASEVPAGRASTKR
ncbi:exported hypothetical protein [Mesorhizobium sp. SOD10]|nr:exported hypothetical protein [Mesorhizobium sp. SOD10]